MSMDDLTMRPDTARVPAAFAVLGLVQATLIFTIALIMIPLPTIADELALDSTEVLALQVAYGLPFSGLLLFGGRLADRYGGRRMLVLGLIVFGAASLGAAVASDFPALAAMRFAEGAGGALVAPSAVAILRVLFPRAPEFGRAMATWGGVSVLGAIVGFVASGILTTWMTWRWMFAFPVLVSVVGLLAARAWIPRDELRRADQRLDLGAAILATAGIVSSSLGLVASEAHPWSSGAVLWPLGAGILLLATFLLVEANARDPLLPPRFLLDRRRAFGLIGMMLAATGSILIEFALLFYLQRVRGWTPLATAVSFLPFAVCLVATNRLGPPLVGRIGPAPTTILGFLVGAGGFGILATVEPSTPYLTVLLPGQVLLAFGISLSFAGSAVLSTANIAADEGGLAGGVMNTTMELGPTVGLSALMAVAAAQADAVTGYAWAFGTAAAAYLAAVLLAVLVDIPDWRKTR